MTSTHDEESGGGTCPFCGFVSAGDPYELLVHVETFHSEGPSPFVAADSSASAPQDAEDGYAECPVDDCGEVIVVAELDEHLALHAEEAGLEPQEPAGGGQSLVDGTAAGGAVPSPSSRRDSRASSKSKDGGAADRRKASAQQWRRIFSRPSPTSAPKRGKQARKDLEQQSQQPSRSRQSSQPQQQERKRLGKTELGRYAHENAMPDWLVSPLQKEGEVKSDGIIPVLRQLLEQNESTDFAYLCTPAVQHISKLRREGGFCGYRNIQMLVSYLIQARAYGWDHFQGQVPSIFRIQDLIETAWDLGINARGRIETGGVRGTRKYIGTPEAQAIFCSLGIPCEVQAFKDVEQGKAPTLLLDATLEYFSTGYGGSRTKVMQTSLPPVYFQQPGHSMTIVGIEKRKDGERNLLVFDPMFHDAENITRLVGHTFRHKKPDEALKPYRRGLRHLRRHREFEVLRLVPLPSHTTDTDDRSTSEGSKQENSVAKPSG